MHTVKFFLAAMGRAIRGCRFNWNVFCTAPSVLQLYNAIQSFVVLLCADYRNRT